MSMKQDVVGLNTYLVVEGADPANSKVLLF
jgi:hypothetical protein